MTFSKRASRVSPCFPALAHLLQAPPGPGEQTELQLCKFRPV